MSLSRRVMIGAASLALVGACRRADAPFAAADAERQRLRAAADIARAQAFFAAGFKDFERRRQPLAQYRGRTVVAVFWATWCKPCVAELPMLDELQRRWRERGVALVGIAIDNADKVQALVREHGIGYPVLVGGNDAMELSRTLGNLMLTLPFVALFDRDGAFAGRIVGEFARDELERAVAAAAGRSSPTNGSADERRTAAPKALAPPWGAGAQRRGG